MGLTTPFKGKFVSASSADNELDYDAIIAGCNAVDEEAKMLSNIEKEVNTSGGMITPEMLSIDDKNILTTLEGVCTGISGNQTTILNTTETIRQLAEAKYNEIQEKLNAEAMQRNQAKADEYARAAAEKEKSRNE